MTSNRPISIGHSPDADDAFMFYALASKAVTISGEDIESLNIRAETGDLDVTAVSAAQYPKIADKYRIMSCGASIGRNYGPTLVTTSLMSAADLVGKRIGVPGEFTTSWLLFQIFFQGDIEPVFLDFDAVTDAITSGDVAAGILLHEGQILYEQQGLHLVMDLGKEWFSATGLPIPLGLDLIHRRMGAKGQMVANALKASIVYARGQEDDALDYALGFGRGIDREDGRMFVRMYVNEDTVDMGADGVKALEALYRMAEERGLIVKVPELDLIQAV